MKYIKDLQTRNMHHKSIMPVTNRVLKGRDNHIEGHLSLHVLWKEFESFLGFQVIKNACVINAILYIGIQANESLARLPLTAKVTFNRKLGYAKVVKFWALCPLGHVFLLKKYCFEALGTTLLLSKHFLTCWQQQKRDNSNFPPLIFYFLGAIFSFLPDCLPFPIRKFLLQTL